MKRKHAALGALGLGIGAAAALWSRRSAYDLDGKVVLITGGSRGLGLALARAFARQGARLALCARNESELHAAQTDLEKYTPQVFSTPADVSDPAQVQALVHAVIERYGRIDVLVNNAGIIQVGPLQTLTMSDFEAAMATIFWGTVHATLAVLPGMVERGEGRIVNITSIGGKVSVPHLLPYSCAKFAAVAFSEGLRAELSGSGVKAVTIAPGLMRTGSFLNATFKGDDEREAAWFSVSASVPGPSMSAERAANQIVSATRRGTSEKILSSPARLMALVHGVFPGLVADAMGLVNRALPHGRGEGQRTMDTSVRRNRTLDKLTAIGQRAAREYLQPEHAAPAS